MSDPVACICGYRGPSVKEGMRAVCPICRTPASAQVAAPSFPPPSAPVAPPPTAAAAPPAAAAAPFDKPRSHYRIPCPRGHVLKAPAHMLGQQVFCPQCNEVFVLNEADSLEHKKRQDTLRHQQELEQAQLWLKRAIVAAVFIVLSFAVMVLIQFLR